MLSNTFNQNTNVPPHSDSSRKIIVAVDGPAASGKGTLAKALAQHLGYAYLDTGALYRIVALATLELGGDPENLKDVKAALRSIKYPLSQMELEDSALRLPEVADAASKAATIPEVREAVRKYQADFVANPPGGAEGVVLDGRDIGTVVYPNADVKFFVTAAPEERARRRFEQLKDEVAGLTLETVLEDINVRDQHDSSRKASPLAAAQDAYVLDTTSLTPAEALAEAVDAVSRKLFTASNDNAPKKTFKPTL